MELLVMPPPTQNAANLKLNKILYFKDMNPFIIFRDFLSEVSKKTASQCMQTELSVRCHQAKLINMLPEDTSAEEIEA
jgi:hypothetical protein